jgi:hypothetical protein
MFFTIFLVILSALLLILGGPILTIPGVENGMLNLFYLLMVYVMLRYSLVRAFIFLGICGVFWDLLWSTFLPLPDRADIMLPPLGWTSLLLCLLATVLHAFTLPYRRLLWYSFTLGCLLSMLVLLTAEYLVVTILTGEFRFPESLLQTGVWGHVFWSGVSAFLCAPLLYWVMQGAEHLFRTPAEAEALQNADALSRT